MPFADNAVVFVCPVSLVCFLLRICRFPRETDAQKHIPRKKYGKIGLKEALKLTLSQEEDASTFFAWFGEKQIDEIVSRGSGRSSASISFRIP